MLDSFDKGLVLQLQLNDAEAFNTLYWQYHGSLYANVIKLVKQSDLAQDIVQEVFITLWEKRATLDPTQPVANWLFAVSYYKIIKSLKKSLRNRILVKNINGDDTVRQFFDNQNRQDRQAMLEKAMKDLSPQKRRVFQLCKLQGKTYEEAADELKISKHTVKEYLAGAISYIKEYLLKHPEAAAVLMLLSHIEK